MKLGPLLRAGTLQQLQAEQAVTAVSVEMLLDHLRANCDRVIDTFRKWDIDVSGNIDKKEFRKGLTFIAKSIRLGGGGGEGHAHARRRGHAL